MNTSRKLAIFIATIFFWGVDTLSIYAQNTTTLNGNCNVVVTGNGSSIYINDFFCPPEPPGEEAVISELGINYSDLQKSLKQGDWGVANQKTRSLLVNAQRQYGSIGCPDLQIVNDLWIRYSNGRFGLATQQQIYRLTPGDRVDLRHWNNFKQTVGWTQNQLNLSPNSPEDVPIGHLPTLALTSLQNPAAINVISFFDALGGCL